ncbi:MAG: hypothetical protein K8T89_26660 [Planctomycetes bacterium]|nr:hypothetical protein [Planctomycetota bacterium]
MKSILRYCLATLAIVGLTSTSAIYAEAQKPHVGAILLLEDNAGLFSDAAKEKAKTSIGGSMGDANRQVHVETYSALTADEKKDFDATGANKKEFWDKWAKSKAKGDRGVMILVVRSPGHVHVLTDRLFREKGFTSSKEEKIAETLVTAFKAAAKAKDDGKSEAEQKTLRDNALVSVADYLKAELPTSISNPSAKEAKAAAKKEENKEGSKWQSYLCIGIVALLGIWLVIGLIRAFTGGGGGGGGGPGGGGGGGGGFMTSLFGGLFGAMAGMWLYNNLMGGHESSAFGGDSTGGDTGGGEAAGGGDFSGNGGAGGDYGDSGGSTGGDWGDSGGGGGDWGGGGGDF